MKKNFIMRAFAVVLSIVIFAVPMFHTATADSAQTISYEVQERTGNQGGNVTVPVIIKSSNGKSFDINGIRFSIKYDSDKLEYVNSASSSLVSGLTSFNNGNVVKFAWFDSNSCKISSNITIATVSFRVKDDATGDAKITFTSDEIYKSSASSTGSSYQSYTVSNPTVNSKVTIGTDSAVQKVIDAIDAIGTVKHDDATLKKIQEASKLYGKLTAAQKAKVTNYDKLVAASKKYSDLADEETKAKVKAEVEKFKTDHKEALDIKSVDDLNLKQYEIIKAAYDKFGTGNGKLSPLAQAELMTEYRRLGYYLELLKDAKAAADEEARLALIKENEKKNARVYVFGGYLMDPETGVQEKERTTGLTEKKSGWTDVLTKTKKNVTANDFSRLDFFKQSWYDPMLGLYPEIENIMNDECDGLAKQFIAAYNQAKKLYDLENPVLTPDQKAANDFITKFTYVLSLTEKTVSYDDLTQIEIALSVYEFLSDGAKELLNDQYTLLQNLKAKASGLTPSNGGNSNVAGPGAYNTKAEANSFYNAFNQTWAKVFAMNVESVTAEDYPVLLAMITNYETLCSLNPEVAGLLAEPMKSVYAMYDKAAALYGDGKGTSSVAGPVAGWDSNNVLEFLGRDVGVIIWILLGLLLLSSVTFVVLRVYYRNLKKNKALFAEEVAL